jgi:hypothetical protein
MADLQGNTIQDQPYNAQSAADQIAMQRQLAAKLLQTQQPQGQMVPGGPAGFYVRPSPLAQLAAALQQGVGGMMEMKTLKEQNENMSKERASRTMLIDKLLNGSPDGKISPADDNAPSSVIPDTIGNQTTLSQAPPAAPQGQGAALPAMSSQPPAGPPPSAAMPPQAPPQPPQPAPQQPMLPPMTVTAQKPPMSAAMPPDAALQPIATRNDRIKSTTPLSAADRMGAIGDLADTGKFGEAVASSMMTHKYQYIKDDNTGRIIGVSDVNPNDHVTVDAGTGMNPKLAGDAMTLIRNTDPTNRAAMDAANTQLMRMGYTQTPLTPQQFAGLQNTRTESASIPKTEAETQVARATVPKVIADTNVANATVPKIGAETARTQVGTVADQANGVGAIAAKLNSTKSEAAELKTLEDQLSMAYGLADKAAGTYSGIKGGVAKYFGGGADMQKLDAALNNARLQAIVSDEAGQGKVGAGLFKAYQEHSLTREMQPEALKEFINQQRQVVTTRRLSAEAESRAHQYGLDQLGYKDPGASSSSTDPYAGH